MNSVPGQRHGTCTIRSWYLLEPGAGLERQPRVDDCMTAVCIGNRKARVRRRGVHSVLLLSSIVRVCKRFGQVEAGVVNNDAGLRVWSRVYCVFGSRIPNIICASTGAFHHQDGRVHTSPEFTYMFDTRLQDLLLQKSLLRLPILWR